MSEVFPRLKNNLGSLQWHMPVMPATGEAKKEDFKSEASMRSLAMCYVKIKI